MPLFGRKEFKPLDVPVDVKPETDVFYLPTTNEVFVDYDAYFERIVHLNSSVWTCAITFKPGLTFDEARESEENALKQIEEFPAALERVILFVVHRFCGRTRLEDLVNDMFVFLKDRYFVDEELQLKKKNRRVRVLSVRHVGAAASTSQTSVTAAKKTSMAGADDKGGKIAPPEVPAPQCYRYRVRVIEDEDDSPATSSAASDNEEAEGHIKTRNSIVEQNGVPGIYEDVKFSDLTRERHAVTKIVLKLIIRYYTETNAQKLDVKKQHISDLMLDTIQWANLSDGPLPVFQQTIRPTPLKAVKEKSQKQPANLAKEIKKEQAKLVKEIKREPMDETPSSNNLFGEDVKPNKANLLPAESPRKAKLMAAQKMIKQQQIDLAPLLAAAEKFGMENLERWRQEVEFLTEEKIQQLRDEIKDAREAERRKNIRKAMDKRRKEREMLMEWKRPRDDLHCDDLKPLPKYEEFVLPDWIPADLYCDLLSVHNFFYSFAELITGGSARCPFTLNAIAIAVLSRQSKNGYLLEVLRTLLAIRTDCADEEDGDEADVDNSEELGYIYNCDMDHKQYGQLIREKSRLHESLRNTLGSSVRHLSVTSTTITEVVRLTLETSGYYASGNLKVRQQARGTIRSYDDAGFHFTLQRADIMEKLKISSVYELSPKDRLAIINVLIQQLLSYVKFREVIDERINGVYELRRDLRNLREFDRTQEREYRAVHAAKDAKTDTSTNAAENVKPSKTLQKLRRYLKYLNEGGANRHFNDADSKQTLLESVPYAEMDIHEVEEFRELQRDIIRERQQSYLQKIFALQARMGWQMLGRDRAYRSYYFLQQFNLFIVEQPLHEDIQETCQEPTPLGQEFEDKNDPAAEDAERVNRLGCTGKPDTCPVHSLDVCSTDGRKKWHYFVQENGVDKLLEALNPRGFREIELSENLLFFKELYEEKMAKLSEKAVKPDFLRRLVELPVELNDEDAVEMAMRDQVPSGSGRQPRSAASAKSAGTKSRPSKADDSTSKRDGKRNFKEVLANGHTSETNGDDDFGGRKRRAAAKRFIDYVYADEQSATEDSGSESSASFGHAVVAKATRRSSLRNQSTTSTAKTSSESFNYRHVSMGLRESDDQRRSQLKRCEAIIRDAMTKPFGDSFAFPVDPKYVPDYYDVIKNPMDLRTMINKLKNYEYDTATDLWADCRLMFDNCAEFNESESSIRQDAEKLEEFLMPRFVEIVGHPID